MNDQAQITVRLRFFGALSESVTADLVSHVCADGTTLAQLRAALVAAHPDEPRLATCMIAVNTDYRGEEVALSDGDEVAMIPPVSGG